MDARKLSESEAPQGLKCGTFGASALSDRSLATGGHGGALQVWDLERPSTPSWSCEAHRGIVNAIDGVGGARAGHGAPEVATAGADGCLRVWDPRQRSAPVASFEPAAGSRARDCWSCAFGDSWNDEERCVAAGYDNGDVKLFDLRAGRLRYSTNLQNGVCGLEFDRRETRLNTLAVSCLEGAFYVIDARTQHPSQGMAACSQQAPSAATLWGAKHSPHNRDLFMLHGGSGCLWLHKYCYPDQRVKKDAEGREAGVAGSTALLASFQASTQPIQAFDWSPDKEGLAVCGSFDQCVRVLAVTGLNKL
jgi:WD40 repeat protein